MTTCACIINCMSALRYSVGGRQVSGQQKRQWQLFGVILSGLAKN